MGRRPALNVQQIQEANRLYDSGWTMAQLAEKYFICQQAVDKYIWHPRSKGRRAE